MAYEKKLATGPRSVTWFIVSSNHFSIPNNNKNTFSSVKTSFSGDFFTCYCCPLWSRFQINIFNTFFLHTSRATLMPKELKSHIDGGAITPTATRVHTPQSSVCREGEGTFSEHKVYELRFVLVSFAYGAVGAANFLPLLISELFCYLFWTLNSYTLSHTLSNCRKKSTATQLKT